jgi:hypothetical protein
VLGQSKVLYWQRRKNSCLVLIDVSWFVVTGSHG